MEKVLQKMVMLIGSHGDRIVYNGVEAHRPNQIDRRNYNFRTTKTSNTNIDNHMRVTSFRISSFFVGADNSDGPFADDVPGVYER